jgi:hypothetical protein
MAGEGLFVLIALLFLVLAIVLPLWCTATHRKIVRTVPFSGRSSCSSGDYWGYCSTSSSVELDGETLEPGEVLKTSRVRCVPPDAPFRQ